MIINKILKQNGNKLLNVKILNHYLIYKIYNIYLLFHFFKFIFSLLALKLASPIGCVSNISCSIPFMSTRITWSMTSNSPSVLVPTCKQL